MSDDRLNLNLGDFQELANNSVDAIWTVDRQYKLRTFNRTFAASVHNGYGVDPIPGTTITELFDDNVSEIWIRRYDRCFADERFVVDDRISYRSGSSYVEISMIPIRDTSREVVVAGVIMRDVTDRKSSEDEMSHLAGRMQALLDSAAELTSTMSEPEVVYHQTIEKLISAFRFDTATIQILEDDHLRVVAATGFSSDSPVIGMVFPLTEQFPNYRVITGGQVLALSDVRTDFPHFQTESDEFDSGNIRSWLGLPLINRDEVIGMITLDRNTYEPFDSEDVQLATGFAHHAAVAAVNARLYKELQDANHNQQTLLRELHHRVKNNMQLVSSLLNVRMGMMSDEGPREILAEIRTQIAALANVHDSIYRSPSLEYVDLTGYAGAVVRDIESGYLTGGRGVEIRYECPDDLTIHIDTAIPFGLLLSELVLNAIKHAFPEGRSGTIRVALELEAKGSIVILTVADDGVGLAEIPNVKGFGMSLVENLAGQIDGRIALVEGPGTVWNVHFPCPNP